MKNAGALLAVICFVTGCASPNSSTTRKSAEPVRIRVLSYNIHHGEGVDGRLDLERIAAVIRRAEPDLVALQEVDDRARRTGGVNQTAELARLTGMIPTFGQAMVFEGGGYGQAILSRWPVQQRTVYTLPQRAGREPRIASLISTRAGDGGPELLFVSTHLDHEIEAIRIEQATRLDGILSTNHVPVILAGDFNATPESAPMKVFSTSWGDAASANAQPTIPAQEPKERIDYVLTRPNGAWRVVKAEVIEEAVASDHRPVLVVLELVRP